MTSPPGVRPALIADLGRLFGRVGDGEGRRQTAEEDGAAGEGALAHGEDALGAVLGPAGARALHPELDDALGGRLDRARADRQPEVAEAGVVHPRRVRAEVAQLPPDNLA